MVATDWKKLDPKAPLDLVPAGYFDLRIVRLTPLISTAMNVDLRARRNRGIARLAEILAGDARARVRYCGGRRGVV